MKARQKGTKSEEFKYKFKRSPDKKAKVTRYINEEGEVISQDEAIKLAKETAASQVEKFTAEAVALANVASSWEDLRKVGNLVKTVSTYKRKLAISEPPYEGKILASMKVAVAPKVRGRKSKVLRKLKDKGIV